MDDQQINLLKSQHKSLTLIQSAEGVELVFRAPSRMEYNAWFSSREQSEIDAGQMLAQSTIVFPKDFKAVMDVIEVEPSILLRPGGIVDSIIELAGAGRDAARGKKL